LSLLLHGDRPNLSHWKISLTHWKLSQDCSSCCLSFTKKASNILLSFDPINHQCGEQSCLNTSALHCLSNDPEWHISLGVPPAAAYRLESHFISLNNAWIGVRYNWILCISVSRWSPWADPSTINHSTVSQRGTNCQRFFLLFYNPSWNSIQKPRGVSEWRLLFCVEAKAFCQEKFHNFPFMVFLNLWPISSWKPVSTLQSLT
jgi:hypothetical protein